MQQILQSLKTGDTILEDVPCPKNIAGSLLIETVNTLISVGTERMLLEFGKANVFGKIKQQPDKVKMVLEKIKTDGIAATFYAIQAKLDQPIPLGYCHVGRVIEVGKEVAGFSVGDRVISNGHHAEIVRVAKNGCAKIPDGVSDEAAAFTIVAAIALQGIRLSQPTLGECYVVFGLGLIGLLTVQLLKAHGCRVLGVDFDATKCALAKQFGAEVANPDNVISQAEIFSRARGVDAVIITATTQRNDLLHQAATVCRKRARIILIGVIGKELSRADFYEKELSFQVSCSYGPGRYEKSYEKKGLDYPIGFVRWTEQRNFEAILDMMSQGVLNLQPLITQRFHIDNIFELYETLENNQSALGILIEYPNQDRQRKIEKIIAVNHQAISHPVCIGFIGAGTYGAAVLAPAFQKTGADLHSVVSSEGVSAKILAKKMGFRFAGTDDQAIYANDQVNTIVISTQHDLHASQVIQGLENGKHVFVEKPLAIHLEDLEKIKATYQENKNNLLMIGFNRRFSPFIQTIKKLLENEVSPKSFVMTVNAGFISDKHWTQDWEVGGSRIIGEACHFIDLLRYLSGSAIKNWQAVATQSDTATITLLFEDRSLGTVHYFSNGHKSFPKEVLEIFCNGKIIQLNNFRKLTGFGFQRFKKQIHWKQNKGQVACIQAFVNAIQQGTKSPIPFEEIMEVSRVSIEIAEYLRQ